MHYIRKILGFTLLLISLTAIVCGTAAIVDAQSKKNSFEGQIRDEFSEVYRNNITEQINFGTIGVAVGLVLLIISIVLIAKGRKKPLINKISFDEKFAQIDRLRKLKDDGTLTPQEFEVQKDRILNP